MHAQGVADVWPDLEKYGLTVCCIRENNQSEKS
jgi:hypothetical protein